MAEHGPYIARFTTTVELSADEMASVAFPSYWQSTPYAWLSGVILYDWDFEKKAWFGSLDGFYARVKKDGTLYDEKRRIWLYGGMDVQELIEQYKPTSTPMWGMIEGSASPPAWASVEGGSA